MTDITLFASKTGSNIVTGLTATAAEYDGQLIQGAVVYGLIKYTFSGAPDLSSVLQGHSLNVTGFTNANNNGSGMYIQSFSNVDKTITVKMVERTNNSEDETGATASATVTTAGAEIKELSVAKNAQGFVTGEKVSAGHLNWIQNQTIAQAGAINSILTAIDVDDLTDNGYYVGRRLTAGDNVTLSDNGDSTERIDVGVFGKSTTAETVELKTFSAENICKATVDMTDATGKVVVFADSSQVGEVSGGEKDFFMFDASTNVEIEAASEQLDLSDASASPIATFDATEGMNSDKGVFITPDKQKMFVGQTVSIEQYNWNGSAFVYSGFSFGPGLHRGFTFNADGTEITIITSSRAARTYTLPGAYSFDGTVSGPISEKTGVSGSGDVNSPSYSADGTKLYFVNYNSGTTTIRDVLQLNLATPYRPGSWTSTNTINIYSDVAAPKSIAFFDSFSKALVLGDDDVVYQFTLGTPGNVTTMSYDSVSKDIPQSTSIHSVTIAGDGLSFYVADASASDVYEYSIGTAFSGTARYSLECGAV